MRLALAMAVATIALLVPAASPSSPLFLGAQLHVELGVDARHLTLTCTTVDHFETDSVDGAWFRYSDASGEKTCAEARFPFDVPAGATDVRVTFTADRVVTQTSRTPDVGVPMRVNFTQELRIYDGNGLLRSTHNLFASADLTQQERQFPISERLDGMEHIQVGWYFEDEGNPFGLPPNFAASQTFESKISAATITFTGIPIEPRTVVEERHTEGNRISRQTLSVVVPVAAQHLGRVGVAVSTSSLLSLDSITTPLGTTVPPRSVSTDTDAQASTTVLDPAAVARHGYGEYRFAFTAAQPLAANTAMTAFLIAMLLLPAVMAGLSIRQWLHLRRQAGSSYPQVAQQYLWAILVAQAVYLVVLAWVLIIKPFPLLVSWPMESQAVLLFGILLACSGAFFALAFFAKGRLVRLAEADLAAKRRANLELERSNRDLEQFAYVASHDLQEPLRAVAGYTQLLQHRYGDRLDPQAKEYIRHAVEGADRMLGLIHGLLAYARIGTDAAKAGSIDLTVALGEALGNLETQLKESKGQVTHGPLPTVHADRTQIVQLLQNLVGNALKFHAQARPPRVHVEARETGTGEWTIEVRDNGIGIPPEHQHRIFQIFQRLHPRDRYPGSGLGLAICQRIVERHGGRIWVESRPGQGARFLFTLPASRKGQMDGPWTNRPRAQAL